MESFKKKIVESLVFLGFIGFMFYGEFENDKDPYLLLSLGVMLGLSLLIVWDDGTSKFDIWVGEKVELLGKKIKAWKDRRQVLRMLHDDDNPKRIIRRRKGTQILESFGMYSFFVGAFILVPLGIAAAGVYYVQFNAKMGYFMILIAVLYTVQVWAIMLKAALELKHEQKRDSVK